jgi:hypothetical protein
VLFWDAANVLFGPNLDKFGFHMGDGEGDRPKYIIVQKMAFDWTILSVYMDRLF